MNANFNYIRRRKRRSRPGRGAAQALKLTLVMAALTAAVILIIRVSSGASFAPDTFLEGVYVGGVSLGGKTYEEGARLVLDEVEQRLSAETYVLTYRDKTWSFTPSEFNARLDQDTARQLQMAWSLGHTGSDAYRREQAQSLKENPVRYDSRIIYDEHLLGEFLAEVASEVNVAPVEATVVMGSAEEIIVTQSQDGLDLSAQELKQTLDQAIRDGGPRTIELKPHAAKPVHTTEALIENTQLIADCWTSTKKSVSLRTRNIRRALDSFNGFMVQPGQTVSFNDTVGARTIENGFFKANEYDGTEVISGIGGGTCQASSTLYGALLKANMEIVTRQPHSMTVDYCDYSMDAAVSLKKGRIKDLCFTNTLRYPVYIYTQVDSERARVRIYGPPCAYDIRLGHDLVEEKVPQKGRYEKDLTGKHAYFTDEIMLKTPGKNMVKSRGLRIYCDKVTGAEVDRQVFNLDTYYEKQPVYWKGIHERF